MKGYFRVREVQAQVYGHEGRGSEMRIRVFCPFGIERWIDVPDYAWRGERVYTTIHICDDYDEYESSDYSGTTCGKNSCKEYKKGNCEGRFFLKVSGKNVVVLTLGQLKELQGEGIFV